MNRRIFAFAALAAALPLASAFAASPAAAPEQVALAMAMANSAIADKAQVITDATHVVGTYREPGIEPGRIWEAQVRTFENGSARSVRVYRVREDATGAIVRATLFAVQGPVGP